MKRTPKQAADRVGIVGPLQPGFRAPTQTECTIADEWVEVNAVASFDRSYVPERLCALLDALERITRPSALRKVRP